MGEEAALITLGLVQDVMIPLGIVMMIIANLRQRRVNWAPDVALAVSPSAGGGTVQLSARF